MRSSIRESARDGRPVVTASATAEHVRAERWRLLGRRAGGFARRYLGRADGVVGLVILTVFAVVAIAPALFVGPLETATTATARAFEPPSAAHLLGADELGRDVLNRTVHGARISMLIGLMATLITILLGVLVGIVAGYVGGLLDAALMRVADFFLVLPTFVLALILAPVLLEVVGAGAQFGGIRATLLVIVVVIGLTSWSATARIIRSQVLSLKERMFVDRARVIGAGSGRIMRVHILPNVVNLIVAQAVLTFAIAVFTETTLSFVGLGDPFQPSWGQILSSAQGSGAPGLGAWWYIGPPAVCVVLVVLSFTLVGNALDDILNPRLRTRQ
jgi:peptide/nickel transport system permease protein